MLRYEITKDPTGTGIIVAVVQDLTWCKHTMHTVALTRENYERVVAEAMDLGWEKRPDFMPGDRVEDNEGDLGTVNRIEGRTIYVDGDAGTQPWKYQSHQLRRID